MLNTNPISRFEEPSTPMSKTSSPSRPAGGTNRSPGISWTDLMKTDARPVPEFLTQESYTYRGSEPIAANRYTSLEFQELENKKMWSNVRQFAAREEDMPESGDYIVSLQKDGSVRAFHNVCLHRGGKLRTADGKADQFQCPFHGFTWKNDGSFKRIPCRWDFPNLKDENLRLPEAKVCRWGGYIFVRENAEGPMLEEFLTPLPQHFERWRHDQCSTVIWVAKVIPANWKATMEAFMEAWHTVVTHPQLLPFTGDENGAYWTWDDNVNVNLVPFGIMSPHVDPRGREEQWIVDEFIKFNGRSAENYDESQDAFAVKVPPGKPMPRGVPMKLLRTDQLWTDAPELGVLGAVFEQDMANLPYVQDGLKLSKTGEVNLSDYQEIRIRQFHQTLDKYLEN